MNVAVYGAGYVGLVSAVCLAELGHRVCCFDVDKGKIAALQKGKLPIYEQGLEPLLVKNLAAKRIHFTHDCAQAGSFGEIKIIAVGTPSNPDGSVNLHYIDQVAEMLGEQLSEYCVIVIKSTVPVGTSERLKKIIDAKLSERGISISYDVISNPEFLKEGEAVRDFMQPDRIVIGTSSGRAIESMRILYDFFIQKNTPFIVMDTRSAELTKYVANAFLATKISFMNEMSRLAEAFDADIEKIKEALGADPRIGNKFINPGCGFGGSCFPKDIDALLTQSQQVGVSVSIINAVREVNEAQKQIVFDKIHRYFKGNLKDRVIALWGLAFKQNTDDIRSAPSRVLMECLWKSGARVQAYDPLAMNNVKREYANFSGLTLCSSAQEALIGADALAIVTEWDEFRKMDLSLIKNQLRFPVIFDGRNLFDPAQLKMIGFDYFPIGRKAEWTRRDIPLAVIDSR